MHKTFVIARREFTEVLRAKGFWFGILLPGIVGMILAFVMGKPQSVPHPDMQPIIAGIVYIVIMFLAIQPTSQLLLASLLEEKSSRVVEVLFSAVSPFELMAGKILGLVAVGLMITVVFVTMMTVVAIRTGLFVVPSAALLALFLVYYLFGFVMYACVFASIGAACSTSKDVQAVMGPLLLAMLLPFAFSMTVAQHPTGFLAVALSIFPPTAPMFMILRVVILPTPPWLEIALSLALLAASAPCVVWVAAKILRTGMLLYGKQPKLTEILRWVRNS
jgi:ABC-2 type transport system permease protein